MQEENISLSHFRAEKEVQTFLMWPEMIMEVIFQNEP